MDRIINVKVSGNHLTKDGKNAGTRGEANVASLRITFGEDWRAYAKYVTFWDAQGMNPTRRTLTRDLLENIYESTLIYLVPIPYEALSLAGELTFTIDGYTDGKRQIGVSDTLEVQDALITDEVYEPTPDQYTQLMMQYQSIVGGILRADKCRDEAETFADEAETSAQIATTAQELTEKLRQQALESAVIAANAAEAAEKAATRAEKAKNTIPDWEQSDENGEGYINNRPFYIEWSEDINAIFEFTPKGNVANDGYSYITNRRNILGLVPGNVYNITIKVLKDGNVDYERTFEVAAEDSHGGEVEIYIRPDDYDIDEIHIGYDPVYHHVFNNEYPGVTVDSMLVNCTMYADASFDRIAVTVEGKGKHPVISYLPGYYIGEGSVRFEHLKYTVSEILECLSSYGEDRRASDNVCLSDLRLYGHGGDEHYLVSVTDKGVLQTELEGGDGTKIVHATMNGDAFCAGEVECSAVVMKSPNGKKFRITIDDDGSLTTTAVE